MRDIQIYLTQVRADIPANADRGAFPLTLPFVEGLDIRFKVGHSLLRSKNLISYLQVGMSGKEKNI